MPQALFSVRDKVLVLRLSRLGRLPPGLYSSEILTENGLPVLACEYGNIVEPKSKVPGKVPRLRLATRWVGLFPRRLRPALNFLATLGRLCFRFANEGRPRLMISHGLNEQAMAYCLYRLFGTPYVAHVHEVYARREVRGLNRIFLALEGRVLRHAVFLIFPDAQRAKLYRRHYRLRRPIEIAANCPRRRSANAPAFDVRKALGIPADARLVGYFGGIGRYNALTDAIRAVARLPKVHFILWGWGEKHYIESLRELARGVGAMERIWFPGELPEDKWPSLESLEVAYCVYEPCVLRMRYQATPSNKTMEALAAGVPILTNPAPDFRRLVKAHDVGAAISEISVDGITAGLRELLQDKLGQKRRSDNGRRCHQEIFHYEAQFAPALQRYIELIPSEMRQKTTPLRPAAGSV